MTEHTLFDAPHTRAGIVPRDYQDEAHDKTFELWDSGTIGVLERIFTGGGKTIVASLIADTWLRRGYNYRVMVISYETQLVDQFAEEIEDFLGIKPGIEMDTQEVNPRDIPQVVVASRASLVQHGAATPEQIAALAKYDIGPEMIGVTPRRKVDLCIRHLNKGGEIGDALDLLRQLNAMPEAQGKCWSRLNKFDYRLNWLVIWDEAHRHAYKLTSVGHVVDWFEQNPMHRRLGLTATPKRGDGVSLGDKMFPGVAIDYPLFSTFKRCAVKEGYAVPYIQKYIEVEGVDFRSPELLDPKSESGFNEVEMAKLLEAQLASLVGPILDLVGNRKTLIFSIDVQMAKNVANFINARCRAVCECGAIRWHPKQLIDDGATCTKCGRFITRAMVNRDGDQARELDGGSPKSERKAVYKAHQNGDFQFLSVCGLCREGYNDPDISCVACLRPISEKASGLAEQIKGRACRLLRWLAKILHTFADAAARVKARDESGKPNALVIDLTGITGLADCASTIDIYSEGLPDEVKARAKQLLEQKGLDEEEGADVLEVIEQANREDQEAKDKVRREREAAERKAREEFEARAKSDAEAKYTTNDVGYGSVVDPREATPKQVKYVEFLGMQLINVILTKKEIGLIIKMLRQREPLDVVAARCELQPGQWQSMGPTAKQIKGMNWRHIPVEKAKTKYDASQLIDAKENPNEYAEKKLKEISEANDIDSLHAIGLDLKLVRGTLPQQQLERLKQVGLAKKEALLSPEEIPQ